MTFPLFFGVFGGDDPSTHAKRFHRRLDGDVIPSHETGASRITPSGTIDGIPVAELLSRLRNDDRTAFATVYDALFESLWRVALVHTQSADAAADVVHDVFLKLWDRRTHIPLDTDIRVYLAVAARNRARDLGKHARLVTRTAESVRVDVDDETAPGLSHAAQRPDLAAESEEFLTAYHRALTLLPEREFTAALLRWEEGFTLEQIAGVLGVSPRGALGIVQRAQLKVREALQAFR